MNRSRPVDRVRHAGHLRLVERPGVGVVVHPPVQVSPSSSDPRVALVGAGARRAAHAAWGRVRRALLGGWTWVVEWRARRIS